MFGHTGAPAKAHSVLANDFPSPTLVPALPSRPFLDACYHLALATSSASATAPAPALHPSDHSSASSLRPCCTHGNGVIVYTHPGALRHGVARLAMGSCMRYVVWRAMCSVWNCGVVDRAPTSAMTCAVACAMACVMSYAV